MLNSKKKNSSKKSINEMEQKVAAVATKSRTKKSSFEKSSLKGSKARAQKFIFVTGGVVSSIGKGLSAASLGALLELHGYKVSIMKCDPYINVDPGTMSPFQHGEVYVTDDGAETDLDLGHYERFTSSPVKRTQSVSTGQIYEEVIRKERRGDYLGGTVQVIPHVTDEIKKRIFEASLGCDICIVEIGGTIGDIEGLPFVEAIRQMRTDLGLVNTVFIHVTYVPYIKAAGELKSKPTQHSVKELREIGIQPDFLICRSEKIIDQEMKNKIGLFCSVPPQNVVAAYDASTIYELPLMLHREQLEKRVLKCLALKESKKINLQGWKKIVSVIKNPKYSVKIALVGKYVDLKESYKSLYEALIHGGIANNTKVEVEYLDSETLSKENIKILKNVHGILVPGGFGERGAEGKMAAIRFARENNIPFFGICFGMQLAAIEFARNVCKISGATSREFESQSKSKNFVIDFMSEQKEMKDKGGTMRLGSFPCALKKTTKAQSIYKASLIHERHRHRYEFNNAYKEIFENNGLVASGINQERQLVEILELGEHPWFIGVQFHPEFKSRPLAPHPLFLSFVKACLKQKNKTQLASEEIRSTTQNSQPLGRR